MQKEFIVGVDEAGRGPVIGPLVICAYAVPKELEEKLKTDGVKDSKLLVASTRERLAAGLRRGTFETSVVTAAELTSFMERRVSLNELEAIKIGELLTQLEGRQPFAIAYIDSPDPQPEKFEKRVRKYYAGKAKLVCENKADGRYPVVGAASIIAKSTREKEIEKIKNIIGEDFNSGYSSDPVTVAFLKRHHNDPKVQEFLRHKWATLKNLKTVQVDLKEFY